MPSIEKIGVFLSRVKFSDKIYIVYCSLIIINNKIIYKQF